MSVQELEHALLILPPRERLRLASILLDSVLQQTADDASDENALTSWIGIFSGGAPDTARQAEEILSSEVDRVHGLGRR